MRVRERDSRRREELLNLIATPWGRGGGRETSAENLYISIYLSPAMNLAQYVFCALWSTRASAIGPACVMHDDINNSV